jgi:hypothetical protein
MGGRAQYGAAKVTTGQTVSAERVREPRLTDYEHALQVALTEVIEQCHNVIDAHLHRAAGTRRLTLNEAQEIAVLRIRLDDLADVQATGSAEAS